MFKEIKAPTGWNFNDAFNYWQKTNGNLIAYISEITNGYQLLLYNSSQVNFSEHEIKTNDITENGYKKLFSLGDTLLKGNNYNEKNSWV